MMDKYLPEKSEIDSLCEYRGDVTLLEPVDQYFLLLCKVPDYELLVKVGIAKTSFDEKMNEFKPGLNDYKQACNGKLLQKKKMYNIFKSKLSTTVFVLPKLYLVWSKLRWARECDANKMSHQSCSSTQFSKHGNYGPNSRMLKKQLINYVV